MPLLRLLPPATVISTPQQASATVEYLLRRGGRLAIDTETTGLDKFRDNILYWSMATESERYFIEAKDIYRFDALFRSTDIAWYLANAKYDMHMLANAGVELKGQVRDIQVQDAMLDDTRKHGLKEQAHYNYDVRWGDFKDLFLDVGHVAQRLGLDPKELKAFRDLKGQEKLPFVYQKDPKIVIDYATCDAYFTYLLGEDLEAQLAGLELPVELVPGMNTALDYFEILEVPLTKALWSMERTGFLVDTDYVKKIDQPMRDGIVRIEQKLGDLLGRGFNPRSSEEVAELFYDHYKLKAPRYTTTGSRGTAEKDLQILLSRVDPMGTAADLLRLILEHRQLNKLHGTYVKSVHKNIGPDGRIHSSINQTGARTSRLSSSDPNLQNIPARNDPYKIRGMFVAPEGYNLVDLDYPQIEFRIAAVLANEEGMMESIRKGWDIHCANAASTFNIPYDDIVAAKDKKERKEKLTEHDHKCLEARNEAKAIGLGTMYGEGAGKIAAGLRIPVEKARESIVKFFEANPGIDSLISYMHQFAHDNEFTHTMLGRIRRLHRVNCGLRGIEAEEERQAFNTLIQGSGAEMMKLAILRIHNDKNFHDLGARLVMTVHDELIAEAPEETDTEVKRLMLGHMADPYRWGPIDFGYPVPIDPDGSIAKRWSDAK